MPAAQSAPRARPQVAAPMSGSYAHVVDRRIDNGAGRIRQVKRAVGISPRLFDGQRHAKPQRQVAIFGNVATAT